MALHQKLGQVLKRDGPAGCHNGRLGVVVVVIEKVIDTTSAARESKALKHGLQ